MQISRITFLPLLSILSNFRSRLQLGILHQVSYRSRPKKSLKSFRYPRDMHKWQFIYSYWCSRVSRSPKMTTSFENIEVAKMQVVEVAINPNVVDKFYIWNKKATTTKIEEKCFISENEVQEWNFGERPMTKNNWALHVLWICG